VLADFTEWMGNDFLPWAAYVALMAGRLLALDKCPGIRPVGIGETWRQAIAKCIFKVAGKEAKETCGIDQLCAGLESGIEGGIHAMSHMWEQHKMEEDWGFLLIDASNVFNEQKQTGMLWAVQYELPSGVRCTFNCYKHWATLVIRSNNGSGGFLHLKTDLSHYALFQYG
jgi:hypothetical protein